MRERDELRRALARIDDHIADLEAAQVRSAAAARVRRTRVRRAFPHSTAAARAASGCGDSARRCRRAIARRIRQRGASRGTSDRTASSTSTCRASSGRRAVRTAATAHAPGADRRRRSDRQPESRPSERPRRRQQLEEQQSGDTSVSSCGWRERLAQMCDGHGQQHREAEHHDDRDARRRARGADDRQIAQEGPRRRNVGELLRDRDERSQREHAKTPVKTTQPLSGRKPAQSTAPAIVSRATHGSDATFSLNPPGSVEIHSNDSEPKRGAEGSGRRTPAGRRRARCSATRPAG